MTCPFLKEARVKYCQTAVVRKLIPLTQAATCSEKCSSAEHASCSVYRTHPQEHPVSGPCPNLCESLMQYCSAAPVTKFVPYSESLLSRCGDDRFLYCELYLAMAHPKLPAQEVNGIAVPGWLKYSANHLWLDVTDEGVCHAGIDGFLSRALGKIDRVSYLWLKGRHRPAAVLSVGALDLEVVFPNSFVLTNYNPYLRADPSRLTSEPYTGGWLFEGVSDPDTTKNLVQGAEAREWMEQEERRMNEFLQQQVHTAEPMAADGGVFTSGLARHLDREQMLALFHEFFSPYPSEKRES